CELVRQCVRQQIDHLHVHFGTNPAEVALLARLIGGPSYSFTIHGPEEFDRPVGLHLREKIGAASHVVAISSYGRSQLYRWIDHRQWPRVRVVHCGLEASFLEAPLLPAVPGPARLVCVGRLCEQKGQLLLLQAVRQLLNTGEVFELVLAGDGEMRSDLEHYIQEHRLGPFVSITGWISSERVKQELQASHAMVLASFAEGLPVVIMEAMALQKPVISTSIAGIPELVRHGVDGWLVPAGDVDALAAAIREALHVPADQLRRMGAMARARIKERHDVGTEASKLAQIFEEAVCQTL
ncbi:MAG: colanic acid biosynthesis glycosyltransferase WcaL, partial [Comamonadaceae bacterium]